jgi:hypothetical protein
MMDSGVPLHICYNDLAQYTKVIRCHGDIDGQLSCEGLFTLDQSLQPQPTQVLIKTVLPDEAVHTRLTRLYT